MKICDIKERIEKRMNDSKRYKIRATYALEILNNYETCFSVTTSTILTMKM